MCVYVYGRVHMLISPMIANIVINTVKYYIQMEFAWGVCGNCGTRTQLPNWQSINC